MFWGHISDKRGRRDVLAVSLISGAVVNAVASLSTDWIMLLTLQFIASLM
jgi:MFS family permease